MLEQERNDRYIADLLVNTGSQVVAKDSLHILIPERFYAKNLAERGDSEMIIGMFPVCTEDFYTFHSLCAFIETDPSRIIEKRIDGVSYSRMEYDPGDALIARTDIVQDKAVIFHQFDEFLFNGKPPPGMGYQDLCRCFDTMPKYSGLDSIESAAIIEIMALAISKSSNIDTYYKDSDRSGRPNYRPMGDVGGVVQGVLNKMAGSGFNEGLVKSLLDDNPQSRKLERTILK